MSRSTKMILGLAGLCVLEFLIFARTSADFFDGDSFFYFPYRITQSSDLIKYFTTLDVAKQLRPLTHVFFSFVMFPLFGLRAPLYGFLSVAFHVFNTLLVFFLIRKLVRSEVAAGAGAAFWGLNPVAIYITHGICFLADYFYAGFYLLSILAFLRYHETHRAWYGVATILAFVIALGTKEAAVTLPVNLAMLALVVFERRSEGNSPVAPRGQWIGLSCFVILVTYLVAYYAIKGGAFYDPSPTGNYRFVPSLAALTSKIDALKAGLYFPFDKYPAYPVRLVRLLKMALAAPILGLAVFTIWSLLRRNTLAVAGLLWTFIALTPVLFIMPTEFVHNMYVPLVGVALIAGLFVERISDYMAAKAPRLPVAYLWASLLLLMFFSLGLNQYIFSTRDWRPYYERVAKNYIRDLKRLHPVLAPNTILYFRRLNENMHWLTYNGKLLNIFYNDASLQTQFSDRNILPEEAVERGQAFILVYIDNGLYDVTRDYLVESKRPGFNLVSAFSEAEISFDRSEIYPNYDRFDTPDGKPAFVTPVGLGNQFYMSLITIAGAGVHYNIPTLTRESKLEVAVAMKFDRGDGAQGRIYFEHGTARDLIYEARARRTRARRRAPAQGA